MTNAIVQGRAPLTQAGQALESSRESGFDLSAAIGEPVDNSFEAGASVIRIATIEDETDKSIVEIAIADDGRGIDPGDLPNVLSLGYSSRYGSRQGLGRFGVGLKLASLSQARRVEVYSRAHGSKEIYRTVLDLDDVNDGSQVDLYAEEVADWPSDFADLMRNPHNDEAFTSGTLVLWRNVDRLRRGGRYGSSVDEKMQDLLRFLGRAYRRFIDDGLYIELDGREVTLHDPLFLLENPRVTKKFGRDLRATVLDSGDFDIDGHTVEWVVSLLPEELRKHKGSGGRATKGREEFSDLYIPDNESKVSILRNEREILYSLVPKLFPGGRDKVDRYLGVEISFPAALDEYFQVRNVKRGAEPVDKLREAIRKAIKNPIEAARKEIRRYWGEVEQQEMLDSGDNHMSAHGAVDGFERTAPSGKAGLDATEEEINEVFDDLFNDLGLDPQSPEDAEKGEWIRESFNDRALTVVDGSWPGKELIEIIHLSGKAIVKVNNRHPFFAEIVNPLKAMSGEDPDDLNTTDVSDLLQRVAAGIDLLILGYAKAENMHDDPETAYGDLRSHWGLFTSGLVREYLRNG
jgi:hypothetical protein